MQTRQLQSAAVILSLAAFAHSTTFGQQAGQITVNRNNANNSGQNANQTATDQATTTNPQNPQQVRAENAESIQPNTTDNNQATDGAWLGVSLMATNESQNQQGAVIAEVLPGSAAFLAGLRPGDVIVRLDNRQIDSANELAQAIERLDANQDITLTVDRNGQTITVQVRLASRNQFFNRGQLGGGNGQQGLNGLQNGLQQAGINGLVADTLGTNGTNTGGIGTTDTTGTGDASQIIQHLAQLQQQMQMLIVEVQQLRQQLGGGSGTPINTTQRNAQGMNPNAQQNQQNQNQNQQNTTPLNQALQNNAQTGAGVQTPTLGTQLGTDPNNTLGTQTTVPRNPAANPAAPNAATPAPAAATPAPAAPQ